MFRRFSAFLQKYNFLKNLFLFSTKLYLACVNEKREKKLVNAGSFRVVSVCTRVFVVNVKKQRNAPFSIFGNFKKYNKIREILRFKFDKKKLTFKCKKKFLNLFFLSFFFFLFFQ